MDEIAGGGMFNGMWGSIANSMGHGATQILEFTGANDKNRELALQLDANKVKEREIRTAQYMYFAKIAGIVIVVGLVLYLIVRKNGK